MNLLGLNEETKAMHAKFLWKNILVIVISHEEKNHVHLRFQWYLILTSGEDMMATSTSLGFQ